MLVENNSTSINRLRVNTRARDSLKVRLAYDRFFSSADVHPTNLPANSIVCVNEFRSPPMQSSQSINANWEQEVRQSLSDMVNRATRPILGKAPATANVVIFADMAELLACLARDWADGNWMMNWWWQLLLRKDKSLYAVWKRHPEFIPAAIQHLVRQHNTAAVLKSLAPEEIQDLGQIVIDKFAVYSLSGLLNVRLSETFPADVSEPEMSSSLESIVTPLLMRTRTTEAPWRRFLPEIDFSGLNLEQERFLAVCLMLQREPSRVRSQRFARAVSIWQREVPRTSRVGVEPRSSNLQTLEFRGEAVAPKTVAEPLNDPINPVTRSPSPDWDKPYDTKPPEKTRNGNSIDPVDQNRKTTKLLPRLPGPTELNTGTLHGSLRRSKLGPAVPSTSSFEEVAETVELPHSSSMREPSTESTVQAPFANDVLHLSSVDQLCEPETTTSPPVAEDTELETAFEVDTNLGGLFYLINLGIYLDFYGDFTTPNSTGIELNIWDFVTVVGAELIERQFPNDPIWSLLETLAGREKTVPPGDEFIPENDWRVPATWLVPFSADARWAWRISGNRLQVIHPAGFLVLDLERDSGSVSDQLQSEANVYRESYSKLDLRSHYDFGPSASIEAGQPLHVWLARLMPYVRARLRLALGTHNRSDPGRLLCQRSARVIVSATHIDVHFGLADLPIEIRLAGLDRDPGWVPAAGRFIKFHYE